MFLGIFVLYAFATVGQNIYDFPTVYYNTDTNRCVMDRDTNTLSKYSSGLYFEFWASVEMPILRVEDNRLTETLDSCVDAAKGYLQYPDSSGYFVELILFESQDTFASIGFTIRPFSNYYMGHEIPSDWDKGDYEWYGRGYKNLQGGFFWNNILCVVASYHWVDFKRAACLFSPTHQFIKLMMYRPIVTLIDPNQEGNSVKGIYYFDECGLTQKSVDLQESVRVNFAK